MHEKTVISDNALVEKIGALISKKLQIPPDSVPVNVETRLHGSGIGLDSLDALRLVASLEEMFDITIDDTDLKHSTFESVGSVVSLVRGKLT